MKAEPELSMITPNFVADFEQRPASNSPNKVNLHFNYLKVNSLERSSQVRQQSLTLKRYKPNKITPESKPTPLGSKNVDNCRLRVVVLWTGE
jgi:hypothetical protein